MLIYQYAFALAARATTTAPSALGVILMLVLGDLLRRVPVATRERS